MIDPDYHPPHHPKTTASPPPPDITEDDLADDALPNERAVMVAESLHDSLTGQHKP